MTDPRPLPDYNVRRLNNGEPVISREHFMERGASEHEARSINGSHVLRLPEWLPAERRADPRAEYYMYFANHGGVYIRLAWAEDPVGPWHLYNVSEDVPMTERGVLAMTEDKRLQPGRGLRLKWHIASPEVHVDDQNRRFVMYFHGPVDEHPNLDEQVTLTAVSDDGLDFNEGVNAAALGNSYFRTFHAGGQVYAFGNAWKLWKGPDGASAIDEVALSAPEDFPVPEQHYWQELPLKDKVEGEWAEKLEVYNGHVRHCTVRPVGPDLYHVFYTVKMDNPPERVFVTLLDASAPDWQDWTMSPAQEIVRPERDWEGVNEPCDASSGGGGWGVHQLRDPFVFEDEGRIYLYYSGAGESAIGVAELSE
jgi:hypothetical protein